MQASTTCSGRDAGLRDQFSEQFLQSFLDFGGQDAPAIRVAVHMVEAADDVFPIADLRIGRAHRREIGPRFQVHQISGNFGGAQVDGEGPAALFPTR